MTTKKNKPAPKSRPGVHASEKASRKAKPAKPTKSTSWKRSKVADAHDRYANQEVSF